MLDYMTLTFTMPLGIHSQLMHKKSIPSHLDTGKALSDKQQHRRQLHLLYKEEQRKEGAEIPPTGASNPTVICCLARHFLRTTWKDPLTSHRSDTGPFAAAKPRRQPLPGPCPLPRAFAAPAAVEQSRAPGGEPSHQAEQPCWTAGDKSQLPLLTCPHKTTCERHPGAGRISAAGRGAPGPALP